ncbi:MAG: class I SAM-dependent methyltransferase [Pseudomonadota bacterium]
MSKFRELVQALRADPLRTMVRMSRAQNVHADLLSHRTVPLDQSLLDGAVLVTDRAEMLRRMPKGGRVAEIGVAAGDFSREILDLCAPEELHLIDPWFDETNPDYSEQSFRTVSAKFAAEQEAGQVVLHRALSTEALGRFEDSTLDWVYIDAAHDYASVADDLAAAARAVRPGGIIAGHDYIRWVSPTMRYGVMEAVNEFAMHTRSPFLFLTNQFDKHDSFAVKLTK